MKCIILAAGYATRLGELTKNTAKPLLKVANKPIISHILQKIDALKCIDEIYVVTNQKFYYDFIAWRQSQTQSQITIINDGSLTNEDKLGAIGDIQFVIDSQNINDDLLIIAGDNLFEDSLDACIDSFSQQGNSIYVHDVKEMSIAQKMGIVAKDANNLITNFVEKPSIPPSTLAASVVYALKKEDLHLIQETIALGKQDRPGDFMAYLSSKRPVYAITLKGKWFDIGSPESLAAARSFYEQQIHLQQQVQQ